MIDVKTIMAFLSLFAGHRGIATTFSRHDSGNPNPALACYGGRPINDRTDMVVAHRTLPCRSKVIVCCERTGLCANATVGDRGPWGRKTKHPTEYRALVDLSPAVSRAVGHNGYEPVILIPLEVTP